MEIPVNYRAVVLAAVAAYAFSWLWYAALSTVSATYEPAGGEIAEKHQQRFRCFEDLQTFTRSTQGF